jgi:Domain of unknown function (DUF1929)
VLAIIVAVTRRDFLKIMGASASVFVFGWLSGFGLLNNRNDNKRSATTAISEAEAQTAGSWVRARNTSVAAIHAVMLNTGKILYIAGSGYHSSNIRGPFEARLLDLTTGSETNFTLNEDLFCCQTVQLPNGNILVAGGTLMYDIDPDSCNGKWHGLASTYEFSVSSNTFITRRSMAAGRWYPTLVELPDGKIFCVLGYDEYGSFNRLVEIYDSSDDTWSIKFDPARTGTYCVGEGQTTCPGAGSPCFGGQNNSTFNLSNSLYPRMHLMPSGLIIMCGPSRSIRSYEPTTGRWRSPAATSVSRDWGTSVLIPLQNTSTERGKILIVGGSPTPSTSATNTVEIIDFNAGTSSTPVIRTVQSDPRPRKYPLPVILPNGKIAIFGGTSQGLTSYVFEPEIFDPISETWTTSTAATIPRTYHSVAILLRNGTVWTASGTPTRTTQELRTEIFRPDYYSQTRPTISAQPTVGGYGGSITIRTPQAASIDSVSLVRLCSTTHHYDSEQRFIWLQITSRTSNSVIVSSPLNANLAPPGYYMIHVLNSSGVPSITRIIKIPGS